jgi:hypothetical protein
MNIAEKELFDNVISVSDWEKIIIGLNEKALNGDLNAIKMLFERRFGKAKEHKEISKKVEYPQLDFTNLSDDEQSKLNDILSKIGISSE